VARGRGHRSPRQRWCVARLSFDVALSCLQIHADQLFLILYRELYYRHVYSRLQPDIDDRFHSYENSCELFNYLLSKSTLAFTLTIKYSCLADSEDGPVPLQLPEQWLWDIVDEFIYQFQSFYVWRAKVKTKTEEELVMLVDGSQVRDLDASRTGMAALPSVGLERV
jgi:RNA polymerase I-associated factor PAF67